MVTTDLRHGDCLAIMREMPDASVDAIVTDPPYGLAFMGKRWDYDVPSVDIWAECLRALKPGGHLLAFAGTRTQHRMAVRIEDAGFEIRDMIAWVYGSGFPKSLDVSKAIDKAAGHWRGKAGEVVSNNGAMSSGNYERTPKGDPVTADATAWQGWGTALKPAMEPITVARKPLVGTVAENVLAHGTGALNVDGCRVGVESTKRTCNGVGQSSSFDMAASGEHRVNGSDAGRWPANLIHDGSEEVVGLLKNDAARFFYCAKASKADRDQGLDAMPTVTADPYGQHRGRRMNGNDTRIDGKPAAQGKNHHPTVKPTDLMRYLCRLVTPPNGVVLDPFAGSGSTGKAAALEGFRFIGIEREAEYVEIARARIAAAVARAGLFERTAS
jgi:site-specific DNA-methyltransferase (adenine-specific)